MTQASASIPEVDEALRPKVKSFLADLLTDRSTSLRARSWLGFDAGFSRAMGKAGLIGLNLPKVYGGHERSIFARFVVLEELLAAGAPVAAHWIADRQSGPLILRFGTEAQRKRYLPAICAGESYFCIGMSEPGAGSDLASVRSRAEPRPGGGWLLNGAKVWTTNADKAHHMIALVRTSGAPDDRHRGLSQLIIDLSLAGISIRPIVDITGDAHFCEVRFDNVELQREALIGSEGDGWAQVATELALERSGPERIYSSLVLIDAWIERLRRHAAGAIELLTLGRIVGELAVLREMSIEVTGRLAVGESPIVEASLIKDLGTSFEQRVPEMILDLAGMMSRKSIDSDFLRTLRYVAQVAPSFSLRGGTREILRGIIARGLSVK